MYNRKGHMSPIHIQYTWIEFTFKKVINIIISIVGTYRIHTYVQKSILYLMFYTYNYNGNITLDVII